MCIGLVWLPRRQQGACVVIKERKGTAARIFLILVGSVATRNVLVVRVRVRVRVRTRSGNSKREEGCYRRESKVNPRNGRAVHDHVYKYTSGPLPRIQETGSA